MSEEILYCAQQYARMGWRLIPLNAYGSRAKHPRIQKWPDRATKNQDKIKNWYHSFVDQDGGIAFGLATGKESGIWVLDIDDPEEWLKLVAEHGEIPETVESQTGGGGNHHFFIYPADNSLKTGTGIPCRGVDVRADGGQVVLPPAPHSSGMEYIWIHDPETTKIATAPTWLIDIIQDVSSDQEWAPLHDIWTERQNDHIHHWARTLVYQGDSDSDIKAIFLKKLEDGGIPNLDPSEPWTPMKVLMPVESGISAARKQLQIPLSASDGGKGIVGLSKTRLDFGIPFGLSDADNAIRLRHYFGHQIKYATGLGWSTWDEHRWKHDQESLWVMRYAVQTTKRIQAESGTLTGKDAEKVRNWAKMSRNMSRLNAMRVLTQGLDGILQNVEDFDAVQTNYMLNVQNGTLDIRTGELRPSKREDLITKLVPYDWDPGAECPVWLETLGYAFNNDPELIEFMQRALGLSLTGEVPEHLFICWGSDGRNGKSTILENFFEILGADYGASFSPDAMMAQGNDNFSLSTLAQMRGVRYATTSESGENDALKVNLVKMITGGDTITVKFMRQDSFNYRPKFKVWIRTNHKPQVSETTDPIWRRIVLIPFNHQIPEDKLIPRQEMDERIMAEAAGVLAWAVRGAQKYLAGGGLQMPTEVREAIDRYRVENDPIGMFILEQCTLGNELTVDRSAFRQALEQWGRTNVGWRKAPSTQKIASYLEVKHGIFVERGGSGSHDYVGVELREDDHINGTMEGMMS